nr:uncharacterized protein CTRU02_15619 [Colletotrichum truncatum]KAF6780867.1 hypothetical protein CTRU02_15619 [Colletotrichum truncatum]
MDAASESQPVQREPEYGLLPEGNAEGIYKADVITVHGICYTSWTTDLKSGNWSPLDGTKSSASWVSDLINPSRVMHYHYDIDHYNETVPDVLRRGGIEREAQKLLDAVLEKREDTPPNENPRPIVFVSHDVGGIIVKKRINAEFLDTKAFLRATLINIYTFTVKPPHPHTGRGLPTPFWPSSCGADVPFELCLGWSTPHLRLVLGEDDGLPHGEEQLAATLGPQIGEYPYTLEPNAPDTPLHKILLSQASPLVPWDFEDFTWEPDDTDACEWITDHGEYKKWQDLPGLGILHIRCPDRYAKVLSPQFFDDMKGTDNKQSLFYHSFSRRDARFNTLQGLFASLNSQIVGRYIEGFRYSFCWALLASQNACTTQDLFQLFWSYHRAVHLNKAVFFICCLDECDETRYKLLEYLNATAGLSERRVRFVVTTSKGRDERLESQLASWPTIDMDDLVKSPKEEAAATKAAEKVLNEVTQRLMAVKPVFVNFKDRIQELVSGTSSQERRLACFFIRWLADSTLTNNTRTSIRKTLDRLTPLTTGALMAATLDSFGTRAAKAHKLLFWVKFAFEKPTLWEVGEALHIAANEPETDDLDDIDYDKLHNDLREFAGLLCYEGYEIDLDHGFAEAAFVHDDAATAHAEMASICLKYLVLPEVRSKLEDLIEKNAFLDEAPVSRPRYNLVSYAAKYWTKHYELAASHRPKAQALKLFEDSKARNLWQQAVYVLSNPMTRIHRGYISALPIICMTGLKDLVAHQVEAERPSSPTSVDLFLADAGLALVEAAHGAHNHVVQLLLEAITPTHGVLSEALLAAAATGDEAILNRLIGVAAKAKDFDWPPGLFRRVAWLGLTKTAKLLLSSNVPMPPFEDSFETALVHMAIEGCHSEMARLLIEAKCDLNATVNNGKTALHLAAYYGRVDVIQSLLATGADINARDSMGTTPLQMALFGGNPQAAKALLEAGADASLGDPESWDIIEETWTARPLIYAVLNEYDECLKVLLNHNVDVSVKLEGKTALWYAASRGQIETCRLLLKHGADPNETPEDSEPLLISVISYPMPTNKIIEILKLLIEHKARLDVLDTTQSWRNNVMSRAVGTGNKELVEFLLEHDVPTGLGQKISQTPLYVAAYEGLTEIVELLLEHGADVNLKSEWGWTPLHAGYDSARITELLLNAGADVDALCDSGTATYLAAKHGMTEVITLLLGHDPKPDLEIETVARLDGERLDAYEDGMTALCIACQRGNLHTVELLLNAGADVNHQTKDGSFPLKFSLHSTEMMEMLLKLRPTSMDLKLADAAGSTVLHNIEHYTPESNIEKLCSAGADVNAINLDGVNPLMRCVFALNIDAFKLLVANGAKVNEHTPTKGSLLHVAAFSGRWDIFKAVIDAGCDVDAARSADYGITPLYKVATGNSQGEHLKIAKYLVEEAKEDPNKYSPDSVFGYPILAAVFSSHGQEVMEYLIDVGANLDVADRMGRTALHVVAMKFPDADIMDLLLKKGANIMARTNVGALPVHFAAAYPWSSAPLMRLLRHVEGPGDDLDNLKSDEDQDDIEAESAGGRSDDSIDVNVRIESPAQAEEEEDGTDKKSTRRELPFDINDKDNDGWTPLMWAAKGNYNNHAGLKALLDRGANLWDVGEGADRQWTPLKIARYYGSTDEVFDLLTPKEKSRTRTDGTTEDWNDKDHQVRMGDWKGNVTCDHCLLVSIHMHVAPSCGGVLTLVVKGILGKRWKCLDCESRSFDLCYKCIRSKDILHPGHRFEELGPEYEDDVEEEQGKPDDEEKKSQTADEAGQDDDEIDSGDELGVFDDDDDDDEINADSDDN